MFGPATEAVLGAQQHAVSSLASCYLAAREARYHSIVAGNPKMQKFLKGWLNGLNDLKKEVNKPA